MSEHKFRYLLPPGTHFQFVSKFKVWIWLSVFLTIGTVAILLVNKSVRGEYMNWTIDFRGGTELIFAFKDKQGGYVAPDPAQAREAFAKAGEDVDISDISWTEDTDGKEVTVRGIKIGTPRFSLQPEVKAKVAADFKVKLADRKLSEPAWSGDRLNIKSGQPITPADAAAVFQASGLEVKPWTEQEAKQYSAPEPSSGEFNEWFSVRGIDRQYEQILEKVMPDIKVVTVQSYGVGAKAGDKLRDDAIKSIIYAIFLIMLYLAFRFDIRYAPGAAFSTLHDAVMVVGVFALTWREVSLTTVAALLTVMGYSVNETVIGFDRIRENEAKLKDKKIERIIDISINERLTRTIMTSSTVFATTLVMNIFGTGLVKNFAFAMNIGVIVATYSSIFLAAPIFLWISKKWYSGPPKRRRGMMATAPATAPAAEKPEPEE
jgi:preprotein translocase subunit SecF